MQVAGLTVGKKLGQKNLVGRKQSEGTVVVKPEDHVVRTVEFTA
jgi:predicted choloylglycine hydrolase